MFLKFLTKQFGLVGSRVIDSTGKDGNMYKYGVIATNFNPRDSSITLASSRTLLRNVFGLPNMNVLRELAYFGEVSIGWNK